MCFFFQLPTFGNEADDAAVFERLAVFRGTQLPVVDKTIEAGFRIDAMKVCRP